MEPALGPCCFSLICISASPAGGFAGRHFTLAPDVNLLHLRGARHTGWPSTAATSRATCTSRDWIAVHTSTSTRYIYPQSKVFITRTHTWTSSQLSPARHTDPASSVSLRPHPHPHPNPIERGVRCSRAAPGPPGSDPSSDDGCDRVPGDEKGRLCACLIRIKACSLHVLADICFSLFAGTYARGLSAVVPGLFDNEGSRRTGLAAWPLP